MLNCTRWTTVCVCVCVWLDSGQLVTVVSGGRQHPSPTIAAGTIVAHSSYCVRLLPLAAPVLRVFQLATVSRLKT